MKQIVITSLLTFAMLITAPLFAQAHVGEIDGNMMGGTENSEITSAEFDEMQDVMLKMMNGEELPSQEWQKMSEFMDDHHDTSFGPMMQGGMMGQYGQGQPLGGNMMMDWNSGNSFVYWIFVLTMVIWLFVGIVLAILLVRKLNLEK
jgi:hypothetical protein